MMNKIVKNRYFLLIVGLVIIYFSPNSIYVRYDILNYLEDCRLDLNCLEIYTFTFLWIKSWIFRFMAIFLNVINSKEHKKYAAAWTIFSILLPGFSLIIHCLIFKNNNRQTKIKLISSLSILLFSIATILIIGKVKCQKEQIEGQNFTQKFEISNLDTAKIAFIDSISQIVDSVKTKYFVQVASKDTFKIVENLDYVPIDMIGSLSIHYNNKNQIVYILDRYNNANIYSYFDSIGNVYLKRILIVQYYIECADNALEVVSQYYENKILLKRDYKIIDRNGNEIDASKCKFNARGVIKEYLDINEFNKTYIFEDN